MNLQIPELREENQNVRCLFIDLRKGVEMLAFIYMASRVQHLLGSYDIQENLQDGEQDM